MRSRPIRRMEAAASSWMMLVALPTSYQILNQGDASWSWIRMLSATGMAFSKPSTTAGARGLGQQFADDGGGAVLFGTRVQTTAEEKDDHQCVAVEAAGEFDALGHPALAQRIVLQAS